MFSPYVRMLTCLITRDFIFQNMFGTLLSLGIKWYFFSHVKNKFDSSHEINFHYGFSHCSECFIEN